MFSTGNVIAYLEASRSDLKLAEVGIPTFAKMEIARLIEQIDKLRLKIEENGQNIKQDGSFSKGQLSGYIYPNRACVVCNKLTTGLTTWDNSMDDCEIGHVEIYICYGCITEMFEKHANNEDRKVKKTQT